MAQKSQLKNNQRARWQQSAVEHTMGFQKRTTAWRKQQAASSKRQVQTQVELLLEM